MKIGVCTDRIEQSKTYGIRCELFFSPLFEMMASMHVICKPEHHTNRLKWWENLQETVEPELLEEIREIGGFTNDWMIPTDVAVEAPFQEVDVTEALYLLEKYPMSKWNKMFEPYGKKISIPQKKKMLRVMEQYYKNFFQEEIVFLEPFLTRMLKQQFENCRQVGIATLIEDLHSRLKVEETELIFIKNKEYHFPYQKIKCIQMTGSAFLSPHLVLGDYGDRVFVVKHYYAEQAETVPPLELSRMYNGLADATRLRILKLLRKAPNTTQYLAKRLDISEAAVSKQLKILSEGGFLEKTRKGNYVYYSISTDTLDFLTYRIYEYLS